MKNRKVSPVIPGISGPSFFYFSLNTKKSSQFYKERLWEPLEPTPTTKSVHRHRFAPLLLPKRRAISFAAEFTSCLTLSSLGSARIIHGWHSTPFGTPFFSRFPLPCGLFSWPLWRKKDDYDGDTVLATRGSINRTEAGDLYSDEEVLMEVHRSCTYGSEILFWITKQPLLCLALVLRELILMQIHCG